MNSQKPKTKHNYTSELELKSLLIRIKNSREENCAGKSEKYNSLINKYIVWHTKINNKKYKTPTRRNIVKNKLKERIIKLSEQTIVDSTSYERFGCIILLMIKNILKKPQFSGYTYKDDFYSDAVYKILKYLHNFDHNLVSARTEQPVNSFAYISQYIHNSVIFIINTKKKESENHKKHMAMESVHHDIPLTYGAMSDDYYNEDQLSEELNHEQEENIEIDYIETTLVNVLKEIDLSTDDDIRVNVYYPSDYRISFDEYNEIKPIISGNISIIRSPE